MVKIGSFLSYSKIKGYYVFKRDVHSASFRRTLPKSHESVHQNVPVTVEYLSPYVRSTARLGEAYKAPTFHFLCGCKSLPSSLTDNDSRLVKVCRAVWHIPIYTVFQKGDTKFMTVTLLILNRFSKFFFH